MPTLQYQLKIDGPDPTPIKSFQQIIDGLKVSSAQAATAAVNLQTAQERLATAAATTLRAELQLDNQLTTNAVTVQRLVTATAAAQAAQTRAATAAEGLARAQAQAAQSAAQAATAEQRLATAQAQTEAAQTRAATAGVRLQQAQQQLARETAAVAQAAEQHGSKLSSFFQNALSAATGFLAANVFQNILGGLTSIGTGAITAAADMERTRAGFTSITGSAQAANALIAQLQQEANRSPFELDAFRQAGQLLLGMGVAADQVVPRLHEVSNVVAAVGGGNAQFERISLALAQIQAKGKVSAQEINQLAENGVAGWDILARALGKTRAEVIALSEQGAISAEVFTQAFSQFAISPAIASAADKQSHTFSGLLSTIHDIGQALEVSFAGPLLTAVEPALERVVTSLQDPQTVATLAQWGAAAGQFVTGLIQAGTTAVSIGGEILGALRPVTDLLGSLFGGQASAAPAAPTFAPAVAQAAQLTTQTQATGTAVKSVKDQIAELERAQRESTRAAAETELIDQHQVDRVKDKIRALQDAYDLENRSNSRAELVAKIQKDQALAVDVVSSQGQAAAKRLVDEQARLRQMDREDQFRNDKAKLESQQATAEQNLQTARENNAKAARDTQAAIDKLRAGQQDAGTLTVTPGAGPSRAVAGDSLADRYAPPQAPAQVGALALALDGLKTTLAGLFGARGVDGLATAWGLVLDGFGHSGSVLGEAGGAFRKLGDDIGTISHLLGLDDGLAKQLDTVTLQLQVWFAAWANFMPTWATLVGGAIQTAVDGFATLVQAVTLTTNVVNQVGQSNFNIGQSADVQKSFSDLLSQIIQDRTNLQTFGQAAGTTFGQNQASFARDRAAILAGRVPVGSAGSGTGADFGAGAYAPGYNGTYTLPAQAAPLAHVDITVKTNRGEVVDIIDSHVTGPAIAKKLGGYASSGR